MSQAEAGVEVVDLWTQPLHGDTWARGKFVLISEPDRLWLVMGPVSEFAYHANLVDRFCRDHQILCSWVRPRDMVEIHDKGIKMLGGGFVEMNAIKRKVRFSGSSKAYGSCPELELRRVVAHHAKFATQSVQIDV
ncbi:MAG TPA: hypothetical protein VMS71_04605 [Candidatus Acidoferrum sp.]|nr:hypothetical protein [Candidatus Acidoferrum sp.]